MQSSHINPSNIFAPTSKHLRSLAGSYQDIDEDDHPTSSLILQHAALSIDHPPEKIDVTQKGSRVETVLLPLLTPPTTDVDEVDDEIAQANKAIVEEVDEYARPVTSTNRTLYNPGTSKSRLRLGSGSIRTISRNLRTRDNNKFSKPSPGSCQNTQIARNAKLSVSNVSITMDSPLGRQGGAVRRDVPFNKKNVKSVDLKPNDATVSSLKRGATAASFPDDRVESSSDCPCDTEDDATTPRRHSPESGVSESSTEDSSDEEIVLLPDIIASSRSTNKPQTRGRPITVRDVSTPSPNPIRRPRGDIFRPTIIASSPTLPEPYRRPSAPEAYTRIAKLAGELVATFPQDKDTLNAYVRDPEMALGRTSGKVVWEDGVGMLVDPEKKEESKSSGKVHLFLDHSNVINSFISSLPDQSPLSLPVIGKRTLSLSILTLLLTRGRPIATNGMHLVGSSPLQQNLDPAVKLGWRCNVLKRVPVSVPPAAGDASKPVPRSSNASWSSDSDHASSTRSSRSSSSSLPVVTKMREQAVDELLHLKLLQTLLLNEPGIIVLATGDAKASQFNEHGFLSCVREALKRGWSVELWAFKNGLSRSWIDTAKRERWTEKGKFVLWALDNWIDELKEVEPRRN